jgi:anti-sigma factor RsiW
MNQCWPEGALRAYLDGELSPQDMQSVAAHLGECAACEQLHTELSVRSGYVLGLMGTLSGTGVEGRAPGARVPARVTTRAAGSWRWTAAAVALAAGLAIATVVIPRREEPRAPVAQTPVLRPVAPPTPVMVPVTVEPRAKLATTTRPRRPARQTDQFLALDDEPIESGIVMRVTVPGSTPADIVFSPDGRARAIRLVSGNQRSY